MKTLIAIDHSGSISSEETILSMSIAKVIKMLIPKSVFVFFDSEITCVTKTLDKAKLPETRGPTDVTCLYDYFKKNKATYSNLIIITDGLFAPPNVSKALLKKTQIIVHSSPNNGGLDEVPFFAQVKQLITF